MANRAHLRCLGGSTDDELVAKYSLPDGWLDLFAPEDLFVGPTCRLEGATSDSTLSYLLCDAPVALERFRARMRRAKIALVGDETPALLFRFFERMLSRGALFVDTTELQWMDEDAFVEQTRRSLARAAKSARRIAPRAETVIVDFGWGSGLSQPEIDERLQSARESPFDTAALRGTPYEPATRFRDGERVAHRLFGEGVVRSTTATTMTVAFSIGVKVLAHART